MTSLADVQLDDHEKKCRCCFRMLIESQNMIRINESIEQKFYDLTQIKLIRSNIYSDTICELCDRDLRNFYNLRKDLSMKQQRLYELQPAQDCFLVESFIAVEALDDAVLEAPEVLIKPKISARKKKQQENRRLCRFQAIDEQHLEHDDGHLYCKECEIFLSSKTSLRRHIDRVHLKIKNFFCDQCSYSSFFKHSLESHVVKHIPEEFRDRYSCTLCSFVSISAVNISLHYKYEHKETKTSYVCQFNGCSKVFSQPSRLTAHFRLTHEKRKEKLCTTCHRAFSTSTRLKEHIMSAHKAPIKEFTCEFCVKQFATLRQLKVHHVYHEEPQYHCKMGCDKKFYRAILLEGHHKTHLKLKDFVCPYTNCESKYFLKSHLKRHIQSIHDNVKFNCEICSSKFGRRENFRSHILSNHHELSKEQVDEILKNVKSSTPIVVTPTV